MQFYQFYLMKHQHRTSSTQHYNSPHQILPDPMQHHNSSLPHTTYSHPAAKYRISRYPSVEGSSEHKNKADLVKNVIDDYFHSQQPFQKTMPLRTRAKYYENNRIARRNKVNTHIVPLQTTPLTNNTTATHNKSKQKASALPSLQHNIIVQQNGGHSKQQQVLPPIHQLSQDCQQLRQSLTRSNYTSTSFYFRSSSVFSQYMNPQMESRQTRVKSYQNEIFTIYIILENGRPIARLKEFKQAGEPVLMRQLKMASYNAARVWQQSRISPVTFQTGMDAPLKDKLCKIKQDELNPSQLRIYPRSLHKKLKANQCEQLRILLRTFCQDMLRLQGKVINNKVNPTNLFLRQDRLVLAEWGHSSFRQTFDIQQNKFESRQKGHLQGQHNWLVSPQYLAPQIISEIIGQQTVDVWQMDSSPDIWSLGLVLLQILTLIPVWSINKCYVVNRGGVIRAGILGIAGRQLHKLHQRQMNMPRTVKKCLDVQLQAGQQQLGNLILKMLDPNPLTRITYQQILALL